jgi:hypothetical protein
MKLCSLRRGVLSVRAVANWRRYKRECGAYGEKRCLSRLRLKHHLGISLGAAPRDLSLAKAERRKSGPYWISTSPAKPSLAKRLRLE